MLLELVAAAAGAAGRRTVERGLDQPRDRGAAASKNGITGRKLQCPAIAPEPDADFAAAMEEVLETRERLDGPACPGCV